MAQRIVGTIEAIAVRTVKNGPMKELSRVEARADGGVDGDLPSALDRGITLLSADQWERVTRDLDRDLPWHTRRANVLVSGPGLGRLIGQEIQVGAVGVAVTGETKPCKLMDQLCPGLRAALTPECRGGVLGRITQSGTLAIGDDIVLLEEAGDAGLQD